MYIYIYTHCSANKDTQEKLFSKTSIVHPENPYKLFILDGIRARSLCLITALFQNSKPTNTMAGHDQTPPEKSHSKNSNASNNNFGMDPSNLYFVHHSDHPGHMLIPKKLNGTNYPSWSKSMIHALTAKNKFGFINGAIEAPLET